MQRKAYVPGVALLAALAAGCTGGSGTDDSTADSKVGETTTSVAAPGKYRTLREPCGSVDRGTLRNLLPGAATLPQEQQEKVYAGTAAVTYDTDRRVGCRWKADSPGTTHQLLVDFERVVSYDSDVSDDDRAKEVYARQEAAADLPAPVERPAESENENATGEDAGGEKGGEGEASTSPGAGESPTAPASGAADESGDESGTTPGTGTQTPEGLEPRILTGLGDAAFLDDALTRSGSTIQRRTVSVVFRTSNVIVTVQYSAQPTLTTDVPDSRELQEKTRALARRLAEQFSDQ
ncbi:hypothetical protein [Streptomyces sp. Wb2n-11]|uniref:hypothetical protein n=1 Tax=Streptomyces sp. Wb2n-11 TaxID=1030533 RepID=UPI000AA22628|nr:hypothetical protein [Streptomyces sp. Wb2n-11]